MDNNLAPYLQSQFGKSVVAAGNFASIFGLLNFFSRPCGVFLLPDTQRLMGAGSLWLHEPSYGAACWLPPSHSWPGQAGKLQI